MFGLSKTCCSGVHMAAWSHTCMSAIHIDDDAAWGRMKGRLDKMGGEHDYDELRKLYSGE